MPAATPRLYFQPLCQHEVFWLISTPKYRTQAHFARVMLTMATRSMFVLIFLEKRQKIVLDISRI